MYKSSLFIIAVAALATAEARAQQTELRVAAFLPSRSSTIVYAMQPFVDRMNKAVGDEVKVIPYWGGALGRSPKKQPDLIKDGITDIGFVAPGYTPGKFPGFGAFELPFIARNGVEGSVGLWRTFKNGPFKGWQDFEALSMSSTEPNNFHTKRRIKSVTDLDGMKIRVAGPVYGSIVKHYNGIPIGMPVTQATEALSRGVVEGVMLGFGGGGVFRIYSIAKFTYAAPLGTTPLSIVMNKKKYNSVSRRVREAIDKFAGERMARESGIGFDKNAAKFRAKAQKTGHNTIELSEADIEKGFKFVQPVHRAWIEANENGQRIYDAYLKHVADVRAGK